MSDTATTTSNPGGTVHPIVMRVAREWYRTGAVLEQIEAFRCLLDENKIDPAGYSETGDDADLYSNLTMACCAYTDACEAATCAAWLIFEELPGWQDDVVKWFAA